MASVAQRLKALEENLDRVHWHWPELAAIRAEVEAVAKYAEIIISLLELGDQRLMASDGPCGGQLPDLSPEEWGKVYEACKRIAARLSEEPSDA